MVVVGDGFLKHIGYLVGLFTGVNQFFDILFNGTRTFCYYILQ